VIFFTSLESSTKIQFLQLGRYYESYKLIRDITGIGEGNGPFVVIHDAFLGVGAGGPTKNRWSGFLQGADRMGKTVNTYPRLLLAQGGDCSARIFWNE
jgi:hypothetical protein